MLIREKTPPFGFFLSYLLAVSPLVFLSTADNAFDVPKECFILVALPLLYFSFSAGRAAAATKKQLALLVLPLLFFANTAFSALAGGRGAAALGEFILFGSAFSVFLMTYLSGGVSASPGALFAAPAAASGLVALYGLLQYSGSDIFSWSQLRVASTFGNPNMIAQYSVIIIPILAGFFIASEGYIKKGLYLFLLALNIALLIVSESRGGWLAAACALAVFAVFYVKQKGVPFKTAFNLSGGGKLAAVAASLIILAAVVLPGNPGSLYSLYYRALSVVSVKDTSNLFRLYTYQSAVSIWRDHPAGVGYGNFNSIIPAYRNPVEKKLSGRFISPKFVHNDYLQYLAETGIAGLGLLLAFAALVCAVFLRSYRRGDALYVGLFSAFTGLLFHSATSFGLRKPVPLLFFMTVSAALLKGPAVREESCGAAVKKSFPAVSALLVIPGLFLAVTGMKVLAAQGYFREGKLLIEAGSVDAGGAYVKQAVNLLPKDTDSLFKLGYYHANASKKDYAESLKIFSGILSSEPYYADALLNAGSVCVYRGEYIKALYYFHTIMNYNFSACDDYVFFNAASLYNGLGNKQKALIYAKISAGRNPKYEPVLVLAGDLCAELNNSSRAAGYYKKALAVNPGNARLQEKIIRMGQNEGI